MTKSSVNSHFPLMVSEQGETVIQLADGGTFGVADAFTEGGIVDRHTAAKEFAARLVRAANCHDDLVKALEDALQVIDEIAKAVPPMNNEPALAAGRSILAKARGKQL